jgi:hypothetical protein
VTCIGLKLAARTEPGSDEAKAEPQLASERRNLEKEGHFCISAIQARVEYLNLRNVSLTQEYGTNFESHYLTVSVSFRSDGNGRTWARAI